MNPLTETEIMKFADLLKKERITGEFLSKEEREFIMDCAIKVAAWHGELNILRQALESAMENCNDWKFDYLHP